LTARRWSFAWRTMRLYVLCTTLLVLAASLTSGFFLYQAVNGELDAIAEGQIKELRVRFQKFEQIPDQAEFDKIIWQLAHKYPNQAAWRVWHVPTGKLWGTFGAKELLSDDLPAGSPMAATLRLPGWRRWRSEVLDKGLVVELVVDGAPQLSTLHRYEMFGWVLVGTSLVLGLLLGGFLFLRVSRLLRRVAESARAVRQPGETMTVDLGNAPDEIHDVVAALRQLLENIHSEAERSRVFYASMAHELRSPIQNLVGETEVALFAQRDAGTYRRVLESNLEELRDLGDAIDNLIAICSRPSDRDGRGGQEEFCLADEAEIRLQRERAHAERHGVALELTSRGDTRMCGDREGILRALRNLAANAIEWSEKGKEVHVRLEAGEREVTVTVDDAGPGVPVEMREQIFDPFYRGPAARGRRIGYGLGLAIVRSAVEGQGGRVEVGTSPEGGARFQLVLPKESSPNGARPRGAHAVQRD
jgi:signal transduction histidine kinase